MTRVDRFADTIHQSGEFADVIHHSAEFFEITWVIESWSLLPLRISIDHLFENI